MNPRLTPDNLHLSEVKNSAGAVSNLGKTDGALDLADALVADFVRSSISENSRRAYRSDLTHFEAWGGCIPATDRIVASYLAAHAESLSVATLNRRLATLAKAHRIAGADDPTKSVLVLATFAGIRRRCGAPQHQAKPLLREDLFQVLAATGNLLKDVRDRALLLIGFAGGFRRSELVGLDLADIEQVRQGIVVHIRRSKSDQDGVGRKIGIPNGRTKWCPVSALDQWLTASRIEVGASFRPMNRHEHILDKRLSGEAVSRVVKERLGAAGFDSANFSGHSLRSGFATSAAQAGVPSWRIRQQTGHASDAMLSRYIRDGELFIDNAAGALF